MEFDIHRKFLLFESLNKCEFDNCKKNFIITNHKFTNKNSVLTDTVLTDTNGLNFLIKQFY